MTPKTAERWAAIDVGPERVHLLVGKVRPRDDAAAEVRHLDSRVRLVGDETAADPSARLGDAAAAAITTAVGKYLVLAERNGALPIVAATEALTGSPQGLAVLGRIESELGIPVRALSVRREAELAFLAVRSSLESGGTQLVVDARGGSTEVTLADGREPAASVCLPVGAGALAALLPGDPPSALEWALEAVRIGALLAALPVARPFQAIVTGEAAHIVVNLDAGRGEKTPAGLSLADLDRLSDEVLRASARKIARRTGDDPRRVAVLAPAALILAAILQRFGLETCTVVPQGLRDGMILAAYASPDAWWQEATGRPGTVAESTDRAPVRAGPAGAEPARVGPAGAEPARVGPAGAEPGPSAAEAAEREPQRRPAETPEFAPESALESAPKPPPAERAPVAAAARSKSRTSRRRSG